METFLEEMKRYLGFTEEDAALLRPLGPRLEKYFPDLAERFYSQIPQHPDAFRVLTGGEAQIARLKQTLQQWARGLFSGPYNQAYAEERYQIGVPAAKREAVFQKFFQADPAQSRSLGGTGLGLAISRRLVEMMGGRIGLENGKDGRGTLVWLTLPLAPSPGSQASAFTWGQPQDVGRTNR